VIALDKLVALRCRDEELLKYVCELARGSHCSQALAEVERHAGGGPAPELPEGRQLYERLKDRKLLDLFRGEPKLSAIKSGDLLALASFCDVQPDDKTMFRTTDAVFMRLADLSKQGPVVVTKLMLDDFCQLAILAHYFPLLWKNLRDLAKRASWTADMLAAEQFLSDGRTVPDDAAVASFAKAAAVARTPDGTTLATVILTPPRFSGMLAEEVIAYDAIRRRLPNPDSLIDKLYTPNPSSVEKGRALAKLAVEKLPPKVQENVKHGYMLRLDALRELTNRRIFVKRDIIERQWPTLHDRMQRDFAGMVQFEKQIQRPESCTEEELAALRPYLEQESLVRVLNLQPFFGHLTDDGRPQGGSVWFDAGCPICGDTGGGSRIGRGTVAAGVSRAAFRFTSDPSILRRKSHCSVVHRASTSQL
jgi:hypothetical protein